MIDYFDKVTEDLNKYFSSVELGHTENLHYSYPKVNYLKTKQEDGTLKHTIEILLPYFEKDDIKIKVSDNTIMIEGERKDKEKDNKNDNVIVELREFRIPKKIKRKFVIPNLNVDSIKGEFKNGVLILTFTSGKRKEYREISID